MTEHEYQHYSKLLKNNSVFLKKAIDKSSKSSTVKLENADVRKWYVDKVSKIKDSIDQSLPIDEKARLAFEARNGIRTEAREMMADEETRKFLDEKAQTKHLRNLLNPK